MAVNKNFVVKNGLEVDTDLIFADASTDRVGIGSTIPSSELDVRGGIAVTDINVSGVGTIVTLKGTSGIVTTMVVNSVQANNLVITGVSTGITLGALDELLVTGVTSTGSLQVVGTGNMPVGIITNAQGTNINYSGIGTLATNVIFTKDASGVGATVGAAVGMVTYYGDGKYLKNTGGGIGIGSTGTDGLGADGLVGYGFTYLDFVGSGVSMIQYNTSVGIATVWIAGGGGGGSGNVSIGSEAPGEPSNGDLWYSTEYGRTFIWFDESTLGIGNTAVWVDSSPFNNGGQFIGKYGDNAFGAIGYTGGTTSQASIYYTGDPNTGIYFPSSDHLGVVAGGTASLVVNPNGVTVTGILTGNGSGLTGVASTDNIVTGTAVTITNNVSITGVTTLGSTSSGSLNVVGMSTFANDVVFDGATDNRNITFDHSVNSLIFDNEAKAQFGDTTLFHNSIDLYIQNGVGGIRFEPNSGEPGLWLRRNLSIDSYFDGALKLQTSGIGITVTGKVVSTAATIGTGVTINNTGIDIGIGGVGIITTGNITGAAATITSALVGSGVTINNTGLDAGIGAGIVTAYQFYGDGSNLSGIAAGGSGEFNTSISGATQYDVTTSMATAYTANASASHRTIVHSIHICNISASEATISAEIQASYSLAHTIPVPAGSAVELLKQPKVLGPSETIELQSDTASALEATIIVEYKEDTDFWDAQVDVTSAETLTDLYTSTTNPSVVQSILLANDNGTNDVKARVVWTDGSDNVQSYLVYDMNIPADSTVEICEKPKYLAAGYKLRVYANVADRLEVTASGKQITS